MRIEKKYFTDYQQSCAQQKQDSTHIRNLSKFAADSQLMQTVEKLDSKFTGTANILAAVAKYLHMDILAECGEKSAGQITLTTNCVELGTHCPDEIREVFCNALYSADGLSIYDHDGLVEIKLCFQRAEFTDKTIPTA